MLQWGHGIAAVESASGGEGTGGRGRASMGPRHCCRGIGIAPCRTGWCPTCFNGATALLPWNPTQSPTSHLESHSRFNGATALLPWNLRVQSQMLKWPEQLQWGHGIAAVESEKLVLFAHHRDIVLQWGHGIAAVESIQPQAWAGRKGAASMGPRHCCRGIIQ